MEQPLRSRSAGASLAITDGTSALGTVAAREQYVLLRVPDCTTRMVAKEAAEATTAKAGPGWFGRLAALVEGLNGRWRRPRALFATTLGVGLVLLVVALVAGNRHKPTHHAVGDESSSAPPLKAERTLADNHPPQANTASVYDEAPPYKPGDDNQGRTNQAARVEPGSPIAAEAITGPSAQARRPLVQEAHLEQRIERAPLPNYHK